MHLSIFWVVSRHSFVFLLVGLFYQYATYSYYYSKIHLRSIVSFTLYIWENGVPESPREFLRVTANDPSNETKTKKFVCVCVVQISEDRSISKRKNKETQPKLVHQCIFAFSLHHPALPSIRFEVHFKLLFSYYLCLRPS